MPARRIRADYDSLAKISQSFGRQAAATQRTIKQIQQHVSTLQGGDWIGKGATAFYREMQGEVLPALKRLAAALEAAARLTQQASQIMHQAEDEAAGIFRAAGLGGIAGGFAAGLGTITGATGGATGGIGFDEFEDFLADYVAKYGNLRGSGDVLELARPETKSPFSTGADSKYGAGGGGGSGGGGGGGGSGSGNAGTVIESQGDKFADGAGLRASGVSLGSRAKGFLAKGSISGGVGGSLAARGDVGFNIGGANIGISLKGGSKLSIGLKVAKRASAKLPFANLGVRFIGTKK